MEIKEIKNKQEYNEYVSGQKYSQFVQSWEWGEFLEKEGKKIWRFSFWEKGNLFFTVSLFKSNLPMGFSYLSAPRIEIKLLNDKQLEFIFSEIAKLAKKEKIVFLRFEPKSEIKNKIFEHRIIKTIDVQPSQTLIIDLSKTEEELIGNMHQKTRYNIRLAERKGVIIREVGEKESDFENFWNIMKDTCGRDGFRLHEKEHYRKMLSVNSDDFKIKLYFAEYEKEVLTANLVSFFGDTVTYIHGASSNKNRNVMAPYLLQWHVVKQAKNLGFKFYDFFGVDELKWPGVTKFKKGFSGKIVKYPGTFDYIFNDFWYGIYKFSRKIRRKMI